MRKSFFILAGMSLMTWIGCKSNAVITDDLISDNVKNAVEQYSLMTDQIEKSGQILNPRTSDKDGKIAYIPYRDWTSGFFPGSMWYLYHLTGDKKWESLAVKYTEALDSVQYLTCHHDVGFMAGCSFLNGMRFGDKDYNQIMVQTAKSLSTRFRPKAGIIQSWNVDKGWQSEREWQCPVIIDNMMNLELLFEATKLSGDSTYYNIAVSHANQTLKHHYRADYSSYHVVDYDPESGEVRKKQTAQGYADESSWARGQAWGLYGYTMCYRYTHKPEYLVQAQNIYNFILAHPNLPKDLIPYWDYNALNIPNVPRDASAAAITASALYELDTYLPDLQCRTVADKIMETLSSAAYRAKVGTNGNFILMHSVGFLAMDSEIDVPLNYADYYFLEALKRKSDIGK